MQFFDILIIFLAILFFIWGFQKGFFYMLFSFLGIVIGIILGLKIPPLVFNLLKIKSIFLYQSISFILIFILIYLIFINIGSYISALLEELDIGWIDAFVGGITGLLQFSLIAGIIILLLYNFKLQSIFPDIEKSFLANFLKNITEKLFEFITKIKT